MLLASPLHNRGILRLNGSDRASFLQGLVTNDVMKVTEQQSIYALMLTPQGKFLYDLMICQVGEEWWLEGDRQRLKDLSKRLSLYKLKCDIALEVDKTKHVFAIWGPGCHDQFNLLEMPGSTKTTPLYTAFTDPRLSQTGVRLIIEGESFDEIHDCQGLTVTGNDKYRHHRLQLGIPESAEELAVEKAIPLECGMDELNAIDWHKGCYMGQELTARTRYRGLVRKRLIPCRLLGDVELFTPVIQDGHEVGEWRAISGDVGLALLRLEALGKPMTANGVEVQPIVPTWMKLPTLKTVS